MVEGHSGGPDSAREEFDAISQPSAPPDAHPLAHFLDNVRRAAKYLEEHLPKVFAKYDLTALVDGRFQKHIIVKAAKEAKEAGNVEDKDGDFEGNVARFRQVMDGIIASTGASLKKEAVLDAIALSFIIASQISLTPEEIAELKDNLNKEKTAAARDARRAAVIDTLIETLVHNAWWRKPSFKGKSDATAREIHVAFRGEVQKLNADDIPKAWMLADSGDESAMTREFQRISKRIQRMSHRTNDNGPEK